MSHTPGPWTIESQSAAGETFIVAANGRDDPWNIAMTYDFGDSGEEGLANARLIAAAPELLAALRDLLGDHIRSGMYRMEQDAIDAARAAIAKAEGK